MNNQLKYHIIDRNQNSDYSILSKEIVEYMYSDKNVYISHFQIRDFLKMGGIFNWINFSYILNDVPDMPLSNETVSVCILTYNNRGYIFEFIQAIRAFASEIIVVDSGSSDGTEIIVEKIADKVIHVQNGIGFDEKRNLGIEVSHAEWILMLDSDEALTKEAMDILRKYMTWADSNGVDIFWLPRYWVKPFCERPMYYYVGELCLWPDPQARLFRKKSNCKYKGRIHEKIYSKKARKAGLILNDCCALYHFKYWFYTEDQLIEIAKERIKNQSDNMDNVQLCPWKYNKKVLAIPQRSLDTNIMDLLRRLK